MIAAGLLLLAVGAVDLLRQMVPVRRWPALVIAAVALVTLSVALDALIAGLLAVAVAAIWTWVVPEHGPARAGLWPVALLALAAAACVVIAPGRAHPGILGEMWAAYRPADAVSVDVVVLVVGCLAFLLESGNAVVRIALRSEMGGRVAADESVAPALKGGRLIGPLERILVFVLTLAGAYTLIAAVLAAKGIVRFPEISRDGDSGDRAEYFLIGSLVSWVTSLAAAFLVWWGVHAA
ncbi:hypothetical protein [Microbacterium trichothecenolyticum]|uniref:Uncharacterized protein n=1 Tax=Microbacterium trichothecenolyticum TaxID=69370 RepID=A0ABU0TSM2_MICTR|nr:hypothetical protein [Microbacterium trichothecenolyticum]MDQ1122664.1 hypothetical protein [Microbacterium trichothecenolyticum]